MPLIVALLGCTVELDAGEPCETVVINEIMTSAQTYEVMDEVWADSSSREVLEAVGTVDWFELQNQDDTRTADLGGYLLVANAVEYAWCEIPAGTLLGPDHRMLVLASTYEFGIEGLPLVCNFDFNNDSDRLQLLSPRATDHQVCDVVVTPDQHDDGDWQRSLEDPETWCDGAFATPLLPNTSCLCEVKDEC